MDIDIITIFPKIFDFYLNQSLLKKARDKKIVKIKIHDLRDFSKDKRKTVDDKPFGGGRGMVIKIEPIYRCIQSLKLKNNPSTSLRVDGEQSRTIKNKKSKIILFTPRGKKFNQKMATKFSQYDKLILISGRYEGIDERVAKYITDEEVSIGDYVLMGGELASLVLIETVVRLLPGVIGKPELLKERISKDKGFIEYPQYTRPEVFINSLKKKKWQVPKVLLSGDHKKIKEWRDKHSKIIL